MSGLNERISICLVHWPVVDKNGQEIASAVTNLDIHDMARLAKTYGVKSFYLVTPDLRQQEIAGRIVKHWEEGFGATYNSDRRKALMTLRLVKTMEDVLNDMQKGDKKPLLVATSASRMHGSVTFADLKKVLAGSDRDVIFVFGTAWGLGDRMFDIVDFRLEPIDMGTGYNHLSVRSAASIILDRILN